MSDFPEYAYPAEIFDKTPKGPMPQRGMTLRDWFAGQALVGIISNDYTPWSPTVADVPDDQIAKSAYDLADAMLKARAKGGA